MEKLPVKLLSELLTPEEIITADRVKDFHDVRFCPVGILLPEEGRFDQCRGGGKEFSEFRYTPRAYFAAKVWETARDGLLKRPEFAGALEIEWYPVAASFRSVRFVNGGTEKFIAAMFEEMKRLADSRMFDIFYGRFDKPALPENPNSPRRYYIMPQKLFMEKKRGYVIKDELDPLQNTPAGTFSWNDIKDVFVVLKPIQLAFIAGYDMNRHTPLDEEFIKACSDFDIEKVRELVTRGANIHAVEQYGGTAMESMTFSYCCFLEDDDRNGLCRDDGKNRDKFIELAEYLLSLGYNINLAGYGDSTCLDAAPHIEDLEIIKFLLDNGADPNAGSFIGDCGEDLGKTVLTHVWDDEFIFRDWDYTELIRLLLRYGALPVTKGEILKEHELDAWIEKEKADGQWDSGLCSGVSKYDSALIHCARNLYYYYIALIVQSGGNVGVRDQKGRNLLQIVLEDAEFSRSKHKTFQKDLAEMVLMLLCGLKLKLSDAEIARAEETCRVRSYKEALDAILSVAKP